VASLVICVLAVLGAFRAHARANDFREGDVIFHSSLSSQARAIELATHSRYSHCGIIFKLGKEFYVYEAAGSVRYAPLKKWIARAQGGHYALRRLKKADEILTPKALSRLRVEAKKFEGKPYDLAFGWSDERIYCSELIYKVYHQALGLEVGKIRRLGDFDLRHPIVKGKLLERYGKAIPLDEPVVSPQDVFESGLFVSVE
jgi:Orthopoxvirus protein of unknown function (DUF830).